MISFNGKLTNDIVSFEQLGPGRKVYQLLSVPLKQFFQDALFNYRIYPRYWDTFSTSHTCPKISISPFYYQLSV